MCHILIRINIIYSTPVNNSLRSCKFLWNLSHPSTGWLHNSKLMRNYLCFASCSKFVISIGSQCSIMLIEQVTQIWPCASYSYPGWWEWLCCSAWTWSIKCRIWGNKLILCYDLKVTFIQMLNLLALSKKLLLLLDVAVFCWGSFNTLWYCSENWLFC